ncbi:MULTISPECIES: GTPase Era [Halomonas]|uniref:GTPase Era n=2 Tax=Halomonas TaxID=2745 RepID=A0ABQ0U1K7_9GAMM|nr:MULTISPECIES: GTPase Era [Halomonas]PSJ21594.1 GTPase Era [Halomonas sp. ND22Bw]KGE77714.1 GTPase Era [Halomonas salina]MDR5889455.1 GTPase Era [Halomonas salina]RAH37021.1 GTPase Era [Halomonas sp. SL1]WJY06139.1 GTPase Era [Halomonas halophila]
MTQRCGFVAIVGRPNVGKSTLMNRILGQKISITSRRPQTTRHQVMGIKTEGDDQFIYVDTPGIHILEKDRDKAINRFMNQAATQALRDVDAVVFIIDRTRWTQEDQVVLDRLAKVEVPVILAVNKVDRLKDKKELLPWLESVGARRDFAAIVPIAAKHGTHVEALEAEVAKHLPESIHYFPEDQVTDKSQRFLAAELVREKVMRQLGDELPYQMTVEIEEFRDEGRVVHISALIMVERHGQKKILIGERGERIKKIGREARLDMERALDAKVMLNLWVKVKSGWSDDERALKSLGYDLD